MRRQLAYLLTFGVLKAVSAMRIGRFCNLSYLMWAHDIVESNNDCWEFMALHVAFHYHLCGGFASRVRIRRLKNTRLGQIGRERFAIHLDGSARIFY